MSWGHAVHECKAEKYPGAGRGVREEKEGKGILTGAC